jgi:hypothetical protein
MPIIGTDLLIMKISFLISFLYFRNSDVLIDIVLNPMLGFICLRRDLLDMRLHRSRSMLV